MASQYENMWKELGLDLQAHDQLLDVLNQGYQDIYLSQPNRPAGMQYFDFVMSEVHGLRIKELVDGRKEGVKVVGSYCVFVPEEIVRAAGATLVGLCSGADFAVEDVETILPRNTCALIKSSFGFKLGKVCPYLETADLIVGENTCDGKKKSYESLAGLVDNLYVMDLPQVKSAEGKSLLKAEFNRFIKEMEKLTGNEITVQSLKKGISIVNDKRKAVHRLNMLRASNPAPISGLDALLINQVFFYDDPVRFTDSVNKICDELEERVKNGVGAINGGAPRLVVSGCPMAVPNWKLPWIIESSGAVIVGEESCVGERGTRNLVSDDGDTLEELIEQIVDRYFQVDCAIFTPNPDRKAHVEEMCEKYGAQGVVHYNLNFCQPYMIESTPMAKNLQSKGVPTLNLDTDYSASDVEQLKTRIQAFLELL